MKELNKIAAIKKRAQSLPDIIVTEEDFKENDYEAYKERKAPFYKLHDDVRRELNAFIAYLYGDDSSFYQIHNKIDFMTDHGIICNTFNIQTNKNWYRGRKELIRLINDIEAHLKIKTELDDNKLSLWKLFSCISTMLLFLLIIFNYSHYIYPFTIMQKVFISLSTCSLLSIICVPNKWKISVAGFFISILLALLDKF